MERTHGTRILSQWDQLPMVVAFALAFIYMTEVGETPPIASFGTVRSVVYMSPENLWHEAIVIGGFTWGLLWMMGASLHFFAKGESGGIVSILEPIRGMLPTGMMALFFGLLASLSNGRAWVHVGLGLMVTCVLVGLFFALKRLPHLTPLNSSSETFACKGRGFFYFRVDDPRILLPRRGGGIALNLAHGRAWCVLTFGMVIPVGLAVLASFGGLF